MADISLRARLSELSLSGNAETLVPMSPRPTPALSPNELVTLMITPYYLIYRFWQESGSSPVPYGQARTLFRKSKRQVKSFQLEGDDVMITAGW
jgi:hypothetical protein